MENERSTRYCSYVSGLAVVHPKWGGRAAGCGGLQWCFALGGGGGGALAERVLLVSAWLP